MPRTRQGLTMKLPAPGAKQENWFTFRNVSDSEAEIDIYGQIGGFSFWDEDPPVTAASFRKQLKDFKDKSKITVHINSPGGSVFEGLAIYNALKQHDAEIKVVVDALAASAASFIAMAADSGQLIMARNAVMMIHDAAGVAMGNASDMREMADLLDKHSDNIADIYAQRTGEKAAFWRMAMVEETWYTGTEAKDAGLIDGILEEKDEAAQEAAASFDLSIFNYAGREQAPAPSVIHQRIKAQMNQAKENTVSGNTTAKNGTEGNGPGGETAPAGGTPDPNQGAAAGSEEKEGETAPAGSEPAPAAGANGDGAPAPGTEPANRVGALTVVINGVPTSDPQVIQRHVTALETAASESKEQGRKDFVAKLATDKKISAGQMESLQTHALSLTDEQWPGFAASWDAAPTQSLLGRHGEGTSNHDQTGSGVNATQERIGVLEDILAHHKRAGKSDEEIANMASFKELQNLKSANQS